MYLKIICILFFFCISNVYCYFTLPGKCPENVQLQKQFSVAEFFGLWYQTHYYASDEQKLNNCSKIDIYPGTTWIHINQSRIDRGLFQRYSIASLNIQPEKAAANFSVTFFHENAPRRLAIRTYPFRVLAADNNYYATVYTCSYSPLIDKHFIYVWILSRHKILNDVSKELAMKPLKQLGIDPVKIVKDDLSKCTPKYYDNKESEPVTFRIPVAI